MKSFSFIAVLVLPLCLAWSQGVQAGEWRIWLETESQGTVVSIKPMCISPMDIQARFEVSVVRSGKAGTSNSRQSGRAELKAGQKKALSQVSLNLNPEDQFQLIIKLFSSNGKLLAQEEFRQLPEMLI